MRRFIFIFCCLLIVPFLNSCTKNNPVAPSNTTNAGKFSFALDAADNIASGIVTLTKGAITQALPITIANHSGSVTFTGIQVGTWGITVQLYDPAGVEIYTGTSNGVVIKDQTTSVTVHVNQNTGTLLINVNLPMEIRGQILYRNAFNGLYLMDLDGSNIRPLIDTSVAGDCTTEGCNYHGGSTIVFIGNHPTGGDYCGIYMANLDGTNVHRLDLPPLHHPRWSWNLQQLTANTGEGEDADAAIVTFNPDGSNLVTLTPGYSPVWSPDNRILYAYQGTIRIMQADGSNQQTILSGLIQPFISDCSADSRILFDAYDSNTGTNQQYVVRIDGSQLTRLTAKPEITCGGRFNDTANKITFETGDGTTREIWMMNADGSNQQQLTFNNQLDEGPVFLFY